MPVHLKKASCQFLNTPCSSLDIYSIVNYSKYLHTIIMLLLTIYEQSYIYATLVLIQNNSTLPSFDLFVPLLGIILAYSHHLFILMMSRIKFYSRWCYQKWSRGTAFLNCDIFWMQTLGLYEIPLSFCVTLSLYNRELLRKAVEVRQGCSEQGLNVQILSPSSLSWFSCLWGCSLCR